MSNYLQLAREARNANNVEEALQYYQKVREEDVTNVEAKFFYGYFKVLNTAKGAFTDEFVKFAKSVRVMIADLKGWNVDSAEKENFLTESLSVLTKLPMTSRKIAYELYRIKPDGNDAVNMYISIAVGIKTLFEVGDEIATIFPEFGKAAALLWVAGVKYFEQFGYGMEGMALRRQDASITKEYCLAFANKIKKYDPNFKMEEKKGFIEKILGLFKKKK